MELAGRPSWRVSLDMPGHLHLVLFVRDAFGLAGPADPPTAAAPGRLPGVPDLRTDQGPAPAAADWTLWWHTVLDADRGAVAARPPYDAPLDELRSAAMLRHGLADGPEFESLADTPDLQRVARQAFPEFRTWWGSSLELPGPRQLPGAKGHLAAMLDANPLLVTQTVARIEAEIGRWARSFDIGLDVLLTAGPDVLTRDATSAVISSALVADPARFAAWLDETLRPLV